MHVNVAWIRCCILQDSNFPRVVLTFQVIRIYNLSTRCKVTYTHLPLGLSTICWGHKLKLNYSQYLGELYQGVVDPIGVVSCVYVLFQFWACYHRKPSVSQMVKAKAVFLLRL